MTQLSLFLDQGIRSKMASPKKVIFLHLLHCHQCALCVTYLTDQRITQLPYHRFSSQLLFTYSNSQFSYLLEADKAGYGHAYSILLPRRSRLMIVIRLIVYHRLLLRANCFPSFYCNCIDNGTCTCPSFFSVFNA